MGWWALGGQWDGGWEGACSIVWIGVQQRTLLLRLRRGCRFWCTWGKATSQRVRLAKK